MKRLVALLAVSFAMSGTVLTAQARAPDTPCSSETACAKPFLQDGLYGIRDSSGEVTIPPRFTTAQKIVQRYPNSDAKSLIITQIDGKFGFVNGDGIETEAPQFASVSSALHGYFIVKRDGKSCLIDRHGRRLLDCRFELILASAQPDVFFVKENGAGRYMNISGATMVYSQPEPARPAAPAAVAAAPAPEPLSPLEQLVRAKKWDEALLAATATGNHRDVRDVLLTFSRTASTRDARYAAGLQTLYDNIGMINTGIWVSGPMEKRELQSLETQVRTWAEGPAYGPNAFRGTIDARTVGECHRAGGTVTVMRNCV